MAKFNVGDWVEITPTPDRRSEIWDNGIHDHFCGKIGTVDDIAEDDQGSVYKITAYFDSYKAFGQPGNYTAWFEDRHFIKSSQYNFKIKYQLNKEYEEYMRVEKKLKNLRDKYLKEVFSDEFETQETNPPTKEANYNLPKNIQQEIDDMNWGDFLDSQYYYYTDDD